MKLPAALTLTLTREPQLLRSMLVMLLLCIRTYSRLGQLLTLRDSRAGHAPWGDRTSLCRLWHALKSNTFSRGGDSFTTSAANASRTDGAATTLICVCAATTAAARHYKLAGTTLAKGEVHNGLDAPCGRPCTLKAQIRTLSSMHCWLVIAGQGWSSALCCFQHFPSPALCDWLVVTVGTAHPCMNTGYGAAVCAPMWQVCPVLLTSLQADRTLSRSAPHEGHVLASADWFRW